MRRLPTAAAGTACALALTMAGCGGSSSNSSSATTAATPTTSSTRAASPPTTRTATAAAAATPERHAPAGGPVPPGFRPVSFTAISPRQFWLLGTAPCPRPVCTSIVRTTDGGAHFVGLPAPVVELADPARGRAGIDGLAFADALDGFAGVDAEHGSAGRQAEPLWVTHDGGAHWMTGLPGVIAFTVSGGSVYALSGACAGSRCAHLRLQRSSARGGQWTGSSIPGTTSSPVTITAHGAAVWLSFTAGGAQGPSQTLVSSSDGGVHTSTRPSPCAAGLGGTLAASSPQVVWAVCPTGMSAGAWRSSDGGAHWQPLAGLRNLGGQASILTNAATIAPASDTTAVIAPGGERGLLRTTDGGKTFTRASSPRAFWSFVGFTDPATGSGLASRSSGSGELWRSTDGGVSWHGPVAIR